MIQQKNYIAKTYINMKKLIRIILSPFVFIITFFAMSLFFGPLALGLGITNIIEELLKDQSDIDWQDELIMTFAIITFPYFTAKEFIETGSIGN